MKNILNLSLNNLFIYILLPLACVLTAWSFYYDKTPSGAFITNHKFNMDAYIENVNATIFNKEGKIALQIVTPKMIHYAENNSTEITNPFITIYRQSPVPWYVNADTARAMNGINEITFFNNVIMHHPADGTNPQTIMNTNSLTIFPDTQIAKTNDAVTIVQPSAKIEAVGMLANMKEGTIQLLSQAREEFEPTTL